MVTGSGGAMGAAIAVRFAQEGADVALNDRRPGLTTQTEQAVRDLGRDVVTVVANVTRRNLVSSDYDRLYEAAAKAGGSLIDRVAHVDEVAEIVLFLCGPLSLSLTGSVVNFDGGFTAH